METEMLTSDAQLEEAENLLIAAQAKSDQLKRFSAADIPNLAERLSILEYDEEEIVMKQGELASWVGIVLSGDLVATAPDGRVLAHMGTGTIVGEFSFFAGGRRATDVKGAERGFIAMVMMPNLVDMFRNAPHTAHKLVHMFGHSSVHKLAFNPSKHKPLPFAMAPTDAAGAVKEWRERHFQPDEHDVSDAEVDRLVESFTYHRFEPEQLLLDRYARNDAVCFVLSGEVALVVRDRDGIGEVKLDSRGPGELLADVSYFDPEAMPCDAIAESGGVLAGISHDAIRGLSVEAPMLGLALMRMIGRSAVYTINPEAKVPKHVVGEQESVSPLLRRGRSQSVSAGPGGATGGRRASVSAGVIAQAEIFYRTKMAKQKAVSDGAQQAAKQAEKEKEKAQHVATSAKILERRMEAEKARAVEELEVCKDELRAAQSAIKNLRLELQQAHESEQGYKWLAVTREEEARVRREAEAELKEELRSARAANHYGEVQQLQQQLVEARRDEAAQRHRADELAAGEGELRRQLDAATAALAEREAQLTAARTDATDRERSLRREAAATAATLTRELVVAEAAAAAESARRRRAEKAARAAADTARLERHVLSRELGAAEAACEEIARVVSRQRLAAKVLAMWDLVQMTATRRKLARLNEQLVQAQAVVVDLPFRNKLLLRQKQSLEAELNEAQRGVAPLRQRLKESDEQRDALEAEITRLHVLDKWHRVGMQEAEQRNESLLRGVNSAQLAHRRSEARLAASRHEAQQKAQQLQRQRDKEQQITAGVAAMARRVAEVEASFGGLLLVSPPGQPTGSWSGRLPGGCIAAAPRSNASAAPAASAASVGALVSRPRTAGATQTQPSTRPRTAGAAAGTDGLMLGVTFRASAPPTGATAALGGSSCGGSGRSSPTHSQKLPTCVSSGSSGLPHSHKLPPKPQPPQPAQLPSQRVEAHSSGVMFRPVSAPPRDAAAAWAIAVLQK